MTNFLEMSAFHAFEKTYFISITAGILCPIFQISVLPALQILCQSSALKNLCQPRCIIPPTSSFPLLMWQNKPRPIRIKALKRSLKPLKVPLNWGMTIWAVWQQMLNGVIASPPQRGLLSHNTQANKHSHMRVHLWVHAHTSTLYPKHCSCLLQYTYCAHKCRFGLAISFFFCCVFYEMSEYGSKPFAVSELLPRMKTNKHDNTLHFIFFPPSFNDLFLFRTQSCQKHHRRQDAEMWRTVVNTEGCGLLEADMKERRPDPLVCVLTMSVWVRANEFCVSSKHNDRLWEQFIWLKIKGVQGVSPFQREYSQKQRRIFIFIIFFCMIPQHWRCIWWCWNDGMPHWCKGEQIK